MKKTLYARKYIFYQKVIEILCDARLKFMENNKSFFDEMGTCIKSVTQSLKSLKCVNKYLSSKQEKYHVHDGAQKMQNRLPYRYKKSHEFSIVQTKVI